MVIFKKWLDKHTKAYVKMNLNLENILFSTSAYCSLNYFMIINIFT